jgi:hypothetical protein
LLTCAFRSCFVSSSSLSIIRGSFVCGKGFCPVRTQEYCTAREIYAWPSLSACQVSCLCRALISCFLWDWRGIKPPKKIQEQLRRSRNKKKEEQKNKNKQKDYNIFWIHKSTILETSGEARTNKRRMDLPRGCISLL